MPSGGVKCPGQVAPTTGSCGSLRPKKEVFKVFELNWWKGRGYHYSKIFFIMVPRVGDGDPFFPVHP